MTFNEEIRDYFSPPTDQVTCDICGDEFGMGDIETMTNHLATRHQGAYARCKPDE